MRMRLITDEDFKVTLIASTLSHAKQDAVARILDQDPMPAGTYNILKTELLRLHEKSAWDRVAELFAMPAMGGQTASELLAAMRNLQLHSTVRDTSPPTSRAEGTQPTPPPL